jgi:hypothetical protein
MSPINSALQYKIQKMEKQLSSLMEENATLKAIINEANVAGMSPTQAFNYGGGAALGQGLAMQPNIGVAGMGSVAKGMSPTSTSTSGGLMGGNVGSFGGGAPTTTRSAVAQPAQAAGGGFNGADFGAFLAGLAGNPNAAAMVAQYLGLPFVGGMQTASNSTTQTRRK